MKSTADRAALLSDVGVLHYDEIRRCEIHEIHC